VNAVRAIISRIVFSAASLCLLALLAGCGHRGPLYMPGRPGDPVYDREHKGENTPRPPRPTPDDDRNIN
jgi:predicted small lipoprotein YifL